MAATQSKVQDSLDKIMKMQADIASVVQGLDSRLTNLEQAQQVQPMGQPVASFNPASMTQEQMINAASSQIDVQIALANKLAANYPTLKLANRAGWNLNSFNRVIKRIDSQGNIQMFIDMMPLAAVNQ